MRYAYFIIRRPAARGRLRVGHDQCSPASSQSGSVLLATVSPIQITAKKLSKSVDRNRKCGQCLLTSLSAYLAERSIVKAQPSLTSSSEHFGPESEFVKKNSAIATFTRSLMFPDSLFQGASISMSDAATRQMTRRLTEQQQCRLETKLLPWYE